MAKEVPLSNFARLGLAMITLLAGGTLIASSAAHYRSERARALSDSHRSWGRLEAARDALERAVELSPGNASLHAELASVNYSISRHRDSDDAAQAAVAALMTATRLNRLDARNFAELGRVYAHVGAFEEAADAFGRALKLDPHNVVFLSSFGRLRELQGRPEDAADLYRSALTVIRNDDIAERLHRLEGNAR